MTAAKTNLTEHARFLRNAAPREFDNFCAAFEAYTREAVDFLVLITGDWQVAQGRAQQCESIRRLLEEVRRG